MPDTHPLHKIVTMHSWLRYVWRIYVNGEHLIDYRFAPEADDYVRGWKACLNGEPNPGLAFGPFYPLSRGYTDCHTRLHPTNCEDGRSVTTDGGEGL